MSVTKIANLVNLLSGDSNVLLEIMTAIFQFVKSECSIVSSILSFVVWIVNKRAMIG